MPGDPTALLVGYPSAAGGSPRVQGGNELVSAGSASSFILWLVVIGVIIPALILGGLQFGGFSFVFRHR